MTNLLNFKFSKLRVIWLFYLISDDFNLLGVRDYFSHVYYYRDAKAWQEKVFIVKIFNNENLLDYFFYTYFIKKSFIKKQTIQSIFIKITQLRKINISKIFENLYFNLLQEKFYKLIENFNIIDNFVFYELLKNSFIYKNTVSVQLTWQPHLRNLFVYMDFLVYKKKKLEKIRPFMFLSCGYFLSIYKMRRCLKVSLFIRMAFMRHLRRLLLFLEIKNLSFFLKDRLNHFQILWHIFNLPTEEMIKDPVYGTYLFDTIDADKRIFKEKVRQLQKQIPKEEYSEDLFEHINFKFNFYLINIRFKRFDNYFKKKRFNSIKRRFYKKIVKNVKRRLWLF